MRKKVLFVINTMGHGGAETALIELMKELQKADHELYLYVMTAQGELIDRVPEGVVLLNKRYDKSDVLSASGKKRLYINTFMRILPRFSLLRNTPYITANFFAMKKAGKIHMDKLLWKPISDGTGRLGMTFDLAIAFTEGAATYYVAEYVNAKNKIAVFHTDYMKSGYTKRLDRNCYSCYNVVLCVSDDTKKSFLCAYPELSDRTDVMRNMIDTDGIKRRAHEGKGFSDGYTGIRILTLGRLVKVKAVDKSIDAMKLLRDRGYEARWYVFGEGEERERLEKQIERLGLSDCFFLPGVTGDPYPYLHQSDIYVQCSEFEGQSIAIREAQVLGLPIVLSRQTGIKAEAHDGVDCIFADTTPEGIADALERLIKSPELRKTIGNNAAKVNQSFDDIQKITSYLEG